MGDCNDKRKRDDSSELETQRVDSPELKICRVDSSVSDDNSSESKLTRADSLPDSVPDSEVELQDDIFNMLEEADNVPERDSVLGLDSVIKSFEDEINGSSSNPTQIPESGEVEVEPNLGYLLEASDDELGLPPTVGADEEPGRVDPNIAAMNGLMGLDDDFPNYDAFGFTAESDGGAGGFVTVDGLFDYAEPAADVLWRSESLQCVTARGGAL